MGLRQGKTKQLLESGIDCALLAVEIYNKPRTPFRVEAFITQMIMAWTKVFHAYFHQTIGEKYFYKKKGKRFYETIDGERKAWELKTCIFKKSDLAPSIRANLEFFIKLRNKIEHRHIDRDEIGIMIFGECQALLTNFENFVVECFGDEYAINESLAFALQFSTLRTSAQKNASKKLLSKEVLELKEFIEKYRNSLEDETFKAQEYSIKLIALPKVSNTNRGDLAIEFVNWNELNDVEREHYERLVAIVKDKIKFREVVNPGKLKPGEVLKKVNEKIDFELNHFDHRCWYSIFSVRPIGSEKENDPFNTDTSFCHYDEAHDDYVYQESWVDFIIDLISLGLLEKSAWRQHFDHGNKLEKNSFKELISKHKQTR